MQTNSCIHINNEDFRIIEKYKKPDTYNYYDGSEILKAIFIDVETTGLGPDDKVIELGLVEFEYSKEGRIFKITNEYNEYQDPGIPIPELVTEITGISDKNVSGKHIDIEKVTNYIKNANLIIAHNAAFDRPHIEKLIQNLPLKPWACSMSGINWRSLGIESSKLEYLAYKNGFFYKGHRANIDCLAGIHLLSKKLFNSEKLVFSKLLENTRENQFKIWAVNSPFDTKDILKNRGYKWHPQDSNKYRAWAIEVDKDSLLDEVVFLWGDIYKSQYKMPIDVINAFNRFTTTPVNLNNNHINSSIEYIKQVFSNAEELAKSKNL